MKQFFVEGGPFMLPTLVFGIITLAMSVRQLINPTTERQPLLVNWGLLTLASGLLGCVVGVEAVVRVLPHFEPKEHLELVVQGVGESLQNVVLALVFLVVSLLANAIGQVRLSRRLRSAS